VLRAFCGVVSSDTPYSFADKVKAEKLLSVMSAVELNGALAPVVFGRVCDGDLSQCWRVVEWSLSCVVGANTFLWRVREGIVRCGFHVPGDV